MMKDKLPELLAPAGDMECLKAAVLAGADAVYFGASAFNARARAKNFDSDTMKEAVKYLHTYGKRAYVTLNTAVKEREMTDALALAAEIYSSGADAVITADIGLIGEIRRQIPDLEVHISTQAGVRSAAGVHAFAQMGATRVVLARELTCKEITSINQGCETETEIFIHGAICVSASGRCLFSSLVGGRSGNRGECAQPCRLPYNNGKYLLSLKDMSLANHIPEIIASGTASLKIEGRLKSPEYVYGVTKIYRTLLDERRNATEAEEKLLERIFSRGGFTDGYFTGRITPDMKGIRGDDPERAPEMPKDEPKLPIRAHLTAKHAMPLALTLECTDGRRAEVTGDAPDIALSRPMTYDDIKKPIAALGTTAYTLNDFTLDMDSDVMIPLSRLKAMRREACEMLDSAVSSERTPVKTAYREKKNGVRRSQRTARFYKGTRPTTLAREYFDTVFVPAEDFSTEIASGAFLPETAFEKDSGRLCAMLSSLREKGCDRIMVSDIGELYEAVKYGFSEIHTDIGFNVYNSATIDELERIGATRVIVSPELPLPAAKALCSAVTVYGNIPLMIFKKCVSKEIVGCDACKKSDGRFTLEDRKGIRFKGIRESGFSGSEHGSILFNSLPTYIGDKKESRELSDIHFIFTTETERETDAVIEAYRNVEVLPFAVRRI